MKFEKSLREYDKAVGLIPSATQTFSKGAEQYPFGVSPIFLDKGKGSHVWDVDGNEFIDYPMGLGAVILGHSYPAVTEAIIKQVNNSIVHSLPHILEADLSQMLIDLIPCAEMVRFGKNGSDATAGAVRAARAITGRDKVACAGYHGWQDWFIGTTTRNKGVPKQVQDLTLPFAYNDISSLEKIFTENKNEIAAVILEPVGVVVPENNFLQEAAEITRRHGAVLIFDEVVTGFRVAMGGAQEYYGVIPDIACFGKGMGNGMPISAVVGKKDFMNIFNDVFFSFTFGGECLSLAAAQATIHELQDKKALDYIWKLGAKLRDGCNQLLKEAGLEEVMECIGLPPHTVILIKDIIEGPDPLVIRTLFQQEAIKKGILAIGVHNISYSHSEEDIQNTLDAYRDIFGLMQEALQGKNIDSYIKGKIVQPVFRKP